MMMMSDEQLEPDSLELRLESDSPLLDSTLKTVRIIKHNGTVCFTEDLPIYRGPSFLALFKI
jgi:hypothetical protein